MTLDTLTLEDEYDKAYCDVAQEFYLPCMRHATYYYRTTGYFSSGIYLISWEALQDFIDRSGKIRIICSPALSNEDKLAIKKGLESQKDNRLARSLQSEFDRLLLDLGSVLPAKLLACLIARNILDIRLAVMQNDSIFHDKVGVFGDENENLVGFRGTMNETYKGLALDGNAESIDVYTNFSDSVKEAKRAKKALEAFTNLWENNIPSIAIYDLPTSVRERFLEISEKEDYVELLYKIQQVKANKKKIAVDSRILRPHQEKALKNWYDVGRRGILEHATGSGKTFTAMCAIKDSLQRNEIPFIVVPSADLLQQWKRELELSLSEFYPTIYLCGDGHSDWKKHLSLITKYDPNNKNKYLILSVLATASTDEFISKFKGGKHIFLVADEVHRLGSMQYRKILNLESGPRLGLSATPQRFGDPVGTDAIYSYFERVLEPKYTLQDAIQDGVLTEYKYFPTPVSLTNEEQEEWNEYTKKICRRQAILRNSSEKTVGIWADNQLKKWLIARAKILKNAHEKINAAVKIIEENYKDGQKWIVYCDNIDNQMEELTHRLKTRYRILEYHSRLNQEGRKAVMNQFNMNGGLLISVKCLDEGVDIPTVTHALIIASSKNPREFIQRRGRVLRKSDNKPLAYLYDLIVLPFHSEERTEDDPTLSIIEAELSRAIRFGKDSPYPKSVIDLNNIAIDYKIDLDTLVNGGYDEDEE